jgi:CRP-like cAMP-binding protein
MITDERLRFLRSVELFASLEADELAAVAENAVEIRLSEGGILFRQGDVPDGVYVLVTGRLAVFLGADDTTRDLGEILPGECVGETALLLATERTATARAEAPSTLLRLTLERFRRALDAHDGLRRMVAGLHERRSASSPTRNGSRSELRCRGFACGDTRCCSTEEMPPAASSSSFTGACRPSWKGRRASRRSCARWRAASWWGRSRCPWASRTR